MSLGRFLTLTAAVCLIFFIGLYVVLVGEISAVKKLSVNIDDVLSGSREGKSLTIISRDNKIIYQKIYESSLPLPVEIPEDLYFMVKFAGENLFNCDNPSTEDEYKLLKFHNISTEGLNNCIVLLTAEKALGRTSGHDFTKLALWKTAADIISRYGLEHVLRSYMENTYMQSDIWGLEAAAKGYFRKSLKYLSIPQKSWLVSVLTLGHMPADDIAEFNKRRDMLVYRLYREG